MELKLNIYNKREIVKTFTTDTYDLMFGTVEDFLDIINLDQLQTGDNAEIIRLVSQAVPKGMGIIKPLIKDVFDGITDEELRNTRVSEIASLLVTIIKYAMTEMGKGVNGKN